MQNGCYMATLEAYHIAILLQMYNEGIIGTRGYTSIQKVRSKIRWQQIASAYGTKDSFDSVARYLVKRRLLSDDGKSLAVLYLDKLGVDFVVAYIKQNPSAFRDLDEKVNRK